MPLRKHLDRPAVVIALVAALLGAVAGGAALLGLETGSSSATVQVASVEGESFNATGKADVVSGLSYASGGKALRLYAGAVASKVQSVPAATRLVVRARKGAECSGAAPHMSVRVDGAQVLSVDVTATTFAGTTSEHSASIGIAAGSHTFTVANDSTGCDRGVRFDVLTLYGNPTPFVGRSGTSLTLNGQPWRFSGLNFFQTNMKRSLSCSGWTANADLDNQLNLMGQNAIRAWFFQRMATNGTRDWSAFDHTLAVANAHGYKVIATLADQWNYCEGPYKDRSWYAGGYKTTVLAGTTVPYRQWVAEATARYKNDPAIAIWELVNEAEDQTSESGSCPSDARSVLQAFAGDTSTLIKANDPNHLVSLGGGGNGSCGTIDSDFVSVSALPNLDVCSYHDYWGARVALSTEPNNGTQRRINECKTLGKPIYAGESGIKIQDVSSLQERANLFANKFNAQLGAGASGFLAWNWSQSSNVDYRIGPGDPTLSAIALP